MESEVAPQVAAVTQSHHLHALFGFGLLLLGQLSNHVEQKQNEREHVVPATVLHNLLSSVGVDCLVCLCSHRNVPDLESSKGCRRPRGLLVLRNDIRHHGVNWQESRC